MFEQYDTFYLAKPILDDDSIAISTVGVVLEVFGGSPRAYEVEFPDQHGGNLGKQVTYTLTEDYLRAVKI